MIDPFEIVDEKPPTRTNVLAFFIMMPLLILAVWGAMIGWIFVVSLSL